MNHLSHKLKEYAWYALKVLTLIAAAMIVITKWHETPSYMAESMTQVFTAERLPLFVLILNLALLNWMLEIAKWQYSVHELQQLKFKTAAKQCFMAFHWAVITPSRIGEYGAKAAFYPPQQRPRIFAIQAYIHGTQLSATLLFGLCSVLISRPFWPWPEGQLLDTMTPLLAVSIAVLALFVWAKKKQMSPRFFSKQNWQLPLKDFLVLLSLSILRYSTFSVMFVLVFQLMGADLSFFSGLSAVACLYLFEALIPVFGLFDVVIRSGIALIIFSPMGLEPVVILSAVSLQWVLSTLGPLILGALWQFLPSKNHRWA